MFLLPVPCKLIDKETWQRTARHDYFQDFITIKKSTGDRVIQAGNEKHIHEFMTRIIHHGK